MEKRVTFEQIRESEEIRAYMEQGNMNLGEMEYTEHGLGHAMVAALTAERILAQLGYDARTCELAKIAGYMHDIGNCVNRTDHAHSGAIMARSLLREMGMDARETAAVMAAIGNHDEKTGTAVSPIAAALILADKADVRRSRVRGQDKSRYDIHDRVNYAVSSAKLTVDAAQHVIELSIELDDSMCSVMDYFEIFLGRMIMCRRAAQKIGCRFAMSANGSRMA